MTEERDAELWLVRHGETEWSRDGRHTSVTDLDLTDKGVDVARTLRDRLAETSFDLVVSSPRTRAVRTAELAGFADVETDEDLVEWDYGDYEGVTTAEIRETVPGWTVWTHPTPGGETSEQVTERLDRVVAKVREAGRAGAGLRARSLAAGADRPLDRAAGRGGPVLQARHRDRQHAGLRARLPRRPQVELLTLRGWSR